MAQSKGDKVWMGALLAKLPPYMIYHSPAGTVIRDNTTSRSYGIEPALSTEPSANITCTTVIMRRRTVFATWLIICEARMAWITALPSWKCKQAR